MSSIFLVKEGYPDYDVRGVCSTLEVAKKTAEVQRGSYTTLIYIIEEWAVDGLGVAHNIWQLEGADWREVLKDGEFVYMSK
jgi:hypothetical protein